MPALNVYLTEEEYITLVENGKKQGKKASEIAQEAIKQYIEGVKA